VCVAIGPYLVLTFAIPISRFLVPTGSIVKEFPSVFNGTGDIDEWSEFSKSHITDNFCLGILAGEGCCAGAETPTNQLEIAKGVMSRMTFVLDYACLEEGVQAVADTLNVQIDPAELKKWSPRREADHHPTPAERIPFKEVYDFLLARNRLDVELYQWSKGISLVNCASLPDR
jgi:hypothetical protein